MRISVVVPAYNTGKWLCRSLDSLRAQTWPDLEIIVINDGSQDDTVQVLAEYTRDHPQIRVIHKENGGVTSARLRGAAEATGDWIAFMDGDDYVEPRMYEDLWNLAQAHGADIAHCGHRIVFLDGRQELVHASGEIRLQDRRTGLRDLLDNNAVSLSLCTKLYRRELFEGLEAWMDPAIKNNEDLLMNYYLFSRAEKAVFQGTCPYHYILRPGSASYGKINEHFFFDPIRVRRLLLERCETDMWEDVEQSLLRNLLFNYAMLTVHKEKAQARPYRQRVRQMIREEKPHYHLLSRRNRILAELICYAPWMFHLAYRGYVLVFQREETH